MKSVHVKYRNKPHPELKMAGAKEDKIGAPEMVSRTGTADAGKVMGSDYVIVGAHQFDDAWPNEKILQWVADNYRDGCYCREISKKIGQDTLEADHTSLSAGDVVQIDEHAYSFCENGHFHLKETGVRD